MKVIKKIMILIMSVSFLAVFKLGINTDALENSTLKVGNSISIAMATDDNYVYPTIVAITSIMEHAEKDENYDFYILLSNSLSYKSKNDILSLQNTYQNCKIKLIDMNEDNKNYKTSGHITLAAYFRLKLPSLLPNLEKILYVDVDIAVNKNIANLYNIDLSNYYIAAVDHPRCNAIGMGRKFLISVGIKDNPVYVNSGILLMNLKKMREDSIEEAFYKSIEKNKNNKDWRQHDQDIINEVCNGKIKLLPLKFNAMQHFYGKYNDLKYPIPEEEWNEAYSDPVIIHYSSPKKPWKDTNIPNAKIWWEYAAKTPFLEAIKDKFLK